MKKLLVYVLVGVLLTLAAPASASSGPKRVLWIERHVGRLTGRALQDCGEGCPEIRMAFTNLTGARASFGCRMRFPHEDHQTRFQWYDLAPNEQGFGAHYGTVFPRHVLCVQFVGG